jgi:hypothetical protein
MTVYFVKGAYERPVTFAVGLKTMHLLLSPPPIARFPMSV